MTLSIVGIEKTSFGYYAAKLEHERAAASGPVPSTVMRATQFHELPAQLIAITCHDSQARVLDMRPVQTVVARTVAQVLLEGRPGGPDADQRPMPRGVEGRSYPGETDTSVSLRRSANSVVAVCVADRAAPIWPEHGGMCLGARWRGPSEAERRR